jgi:His/Glu/Gln/Arg/opine family amino acid ABC transporter permease subunit
MSNDTNHQVQINYTEPIEKPAPLLEVGVLAWLRKNLFGSPLDAVLTLLGIFIVVAVIISAIEWWVQDADWFAIKYNLRQFMVGRLENIHLERIALAVVFSMFTAGALIAAYTRRSTALTITVLTIIGVCLIPALVIPPLANALVPLPPSYLVAGNMDVVSGTSTEQPIPQLAFIARAGEQITISHPDFVTSDEATAELYGFVDRATNTLRNAAINRLNAIARVAEINRLFAEDAELQAATNGVQRRLTAAQRADLEAELGRIQYVPAEAAADRIAEIDTALQNDSLSPEDRAALETELASLALPPTVITTYALNQQPVTLRILNAALEPIQDTAILEPAGEPVTFTIPADGWYIIEKSVESETSSAAILAVLGIYPVFPSSDRFIRVTDDFDVTGKPPKIGDDEARAIVLVENKYRGNRPFGDYVRIYLGSFLQDSNDRKVTQGILFASLALIAGYGVTQFVENQFGGKRARRTANWLMIATPIVLFALINGTGVGLSFTDSDRWGGLLLALFITIYGTILAFPLGVGLALGRRSTLPAVKWLCTLVIELVRGTPFIVVLFAGQLLIPLIHPSLANIPNAYRALAATVIFIAAYLAENVRGGLQAIPRGQEEAGKAIGLANWQVTLFITLPQALRAVIPALVGQFISLFKDTSLLVIVGLLDLTNAVNTMVAQAEFNDARREGLIFITIIYFVISYVMGYVSRRLEESGSGSARRI